MATDQNGELLINEESSAALDENEQKSSALGFLSNTDVLRQITLILGLAICLAIAVFILLWGKEPDMRPLGTYSTQELVKTLDYLDAQKIPYEVDGKSVLVSAEKYADIRLRLTRAGLATNTDASNDGESILLKDSSFGVSQRMETERLKLSRERQLASAIEQFQNVAKAQVLLAIPKDNVFARNERKPSATVVLSLKGNALGQGEVDSIVDMVASAVHGLEPTRVTVTDQNGRLLNSGSQDPVSAQTRKEFAMQQKQEVEYKQKIDAILIPVLGADNYTAEVDLSLDFSQQEQTRKTYNPDLPAVRSEMTLEENSASGSNGGVPGALTNQPPAASNIPEEAAGGDGGAASSSGRSRKEATRNFELDTTVSHIRRQMGGIRRMTVSVAVDYKSIAGADGAVTREARSQAELDTLRRLLSGGLGFDVTRGDTLEVVAIPFNRPELENVADAPIYEQPWFWRAVRIAASVLVIIVLIVTVVRPMLKRLLYPDARPEGDLDLDNSIVLGGDDELSLLAAQAESEPVFGVRDGHLKLPDLHRDEDLLKAVRALVANEPDLAAQVIKEWVSNKDA
ncbi:MULTISPECIES: flagellar basal-body MS-ring/collar protein FliF [Aeromonas]|uniref:Flagellar M-ring protein n=4 Tax=Aeromonas salmonicida TaxID=645 RepID=A0AAX1PP74_AERSA|nr:MULTISPECIES: flagellar basal-body MS-ring/collar protein FliF [Aeromonas]MBP6384418.1 flagellar M-ring protein FliF [Aeromonas sp.]ABO89439.1 flagellar M-ring protein FliF [Aeromonas salmonicida subsp. salmonicida A449]ATP10457.1 flagellar M-ring protein FliF [Aeromonas salmonicida subsp. pectinolytica 34mel]EHI50965.1 flagellar MS-ring protein [Aeromonas salmonicida subsp. salmonicida 01-B526]EKP0240061.1 flagellar M-ring protein FliF [Aeromonas salmonicida]